MFGVMFVERVANGMSKSGDNIITIMRRGVCLPMFIITVYYYISIIIIIISSVGLLEMSPTSSPSAAFMFGFLY